MAEKRFIKYVEHGKVVAVRAYVKCQHDGHTYRRTVEDIFEIERYDRVLRCKLKDLYGTVMIRNEHYIAHWNRHLERFETEITLSVWTTSHETGEYMIRETIDKETFKHCVEVIEAWKKSRMVRAQFLRRLREFEKEGGIWNG